MKNHIRPTESVDCPEEEDPVLQRIELDYQRAMEPILRRMAEQSRSLKRWGIVALLMPFLFVGALWLDQQRLRQVVASAPAGHLLDLRPVQQPKGFRPVVLVAQSSTGFFSLRDPMNLAPGAELVRQDRKSGRQYLCDRRCTQCAEIAQPSQP